MRKEFYLDQLGNFNFKASFSEDEDICVENGEFFPLTSNRYSDEGLFTNGHILHVSINKNILLDGIRGFIGHHNSIMEATLYANFENTTFGESHKFLIVRESDGAMAPYLDIVFKDNDSLRYETLRMNFSKYMPLHLIDFLTEYVD